MSSRRRVRRSKKKKGSKGGKQATQKVSTDTDTETTQPVRRSKRLKRRSKRFSNTGNLTGKQATQKVLTDTVVNVVGMPPYKVFTKILYTMLRGMIKDTDVKVLVNLETRKYIHRTVIIKMLGMLKRENVPTTNTLNLKTLVTLLGLEADFKEYITSETDPEEVIEKLCDANSIDFNKYFEQKIKKKNKKNKKNKNKESKDEVKDYEMIISDASFKRLATHFGYGYIMSEVIEPLKKVFLVCLKMFLDTYKTKIDCYIKERKKKNEQTTNEQTTNTQTTNTQTFIITSIFESDPIFIGKLCIDEDVDKRVKLFDKYLEKHKRLLHMYINSYKHFFKVKGIKYDSDKKKLTNSKGQTHNLNISYFLSKYLSHWRTKDKKHLMIAYMFEHTQNKLIQKCLGEKIAYRLINVNNKYDEMFMEFMLHRVKEYCKDTSSDKNGQMITEFETILKNQNKTPMLFKQVKEQLIQQLINICDTYKMMKDDKEGNTTMVAKFKDYMLNNYSVGSKFNTYTNEDKYMFATNVIQVFYTTVSQSLDKNAQQNLALLLYVYCDYVDDVEKKKTSKADDDKQSTTAIPLGSFVIQ